MVVMDVRLSFCRNLMVVVRLVVVMMFGVLVLNLYGGGVYFVFEKCML